MVCFPSSGTVQVINLRLGYNNLAGLLLCFRKIQKFLNEKEQCTQNSFIDFVHEQRRRRQNIIISINVLIVCFCFDQNYNIVILTQREYNQ